MRRLLMTLALAGTGALSGGWPADASAAIAEYRFNTNTLAATANDANVTATNISGGSLATSSTNFTFQNTTWYTAAPFYAVARGGSNPSDNSGYYARFVVTAAPGYELDLTSFTFTGAAGGGTANQRSWAIYTSVDGLELLAANKTDIASGPDVNSGSFSMVRNVNTTQTMPTYTADLSAARFQNLPSIEIRVYFKTTDNGQNIDVDNFVLNGTVSPIPEPAAGALLLAPLLGLRRREGSRRGNRG